MRTEHTSFKPRPRLVAPQFALTVAIGLGIALSLSGTGERASVNVLRVPEGGIQPEVVRDKLGTVHLVYYLGDPAKGNLYYVKSRDDGHSFSRPLRVNSQAGSAVALGNIRGATLAVGTNGRVHVTWNGSRSADPKGPGNQPPMLYTRLNDAGTEFEPERNVIQSAYGIDGGGAVVADQHGYVYVFWHAPLPGQDGEENRRVWMARSADDGKTFEHEKVAYQEPTGACGCCRLDGFADDKGSVYVLFRSATALVNRDMYLLVSTDQGQDFRGSKIAKWSVGYCVMSTESFAQDTAGVLAAWESENQIYFTRIEPGSAKISIPVAAIGPAGKRKHPAVAGNRRGETLLAWTEGMAWKKGGSIAWQVYDKDGHPEPASGKTEGVPAWSLIAAFTRHDGGFTVLY